MLTTEKLLDLTTVPIGRRTGLADPYAPSTPLPFSKFQTGNDVTLDAWLKPVIARSINPLKPYPSRPLGAFEMAFTGRPIMRGLSDTDRWKQRSETERADRIARTRRAPVVVLTGGGQGWDWIRGGRTIRPSLPFGRLGAVAVTRIGAERGVQGMQLQIPKHVIDRLAHAAMDREASPVSTFTLPMGEERVPMLRAPVSNPDPRPPGAVSGSAQLLYIVAAVAVVFLIVRGSK